MCWPQAPEEHERVPDADDSVGGLPFMQSREIGLAGIPLLAQRVTYVGELGWELYADPAWAGQVWDRFMAAGGEAGIVQAGYRVRASVRMEQGYRCCGTDMRLLDRPCEA